MNISPKSSLIDVCFAVCTVLDRAGTKAVLTGGSAATYYAPHRYQSLDADFVIVMSLDTDSARAALSHLGFTEAGGIYSHSQSRYTLEFPPGPLAVGAEVIRNYDTVKRKSEILYILSRTDSVCDRLAGFYHWADRSALRTAINIAFGGQIDLARIKRWSAAERSTEKFQQFLKLFETQSEK
ncbi:MAG: hypothetical protein M3Y21_12620 [Candidatus Eremiobacteraeota bacterium]|nr:hypothetical protein [Candidatus Eremiobacteraeota bacterium]